jgi:protein TonB
MAFSKTHYLYKMKKSLSLVLFVFNLSFLTFSQHIERKFVDKNFISTDSASANFTLLIKRDAAFMDQGVVKTLDMNGNLLQSSEYSSISQNMLDGESITYYLNSTQKRSVKTYENNNETGLFEFYYNDGSLQAKGKKRNGLLTDSLISFYPNGSRKRSEIYLNGVLISGNCFDSLGVTISNFPLETEAEFPGGNEGLMAFIQNNLVYPSDAIELNLSGKVYVRFVVDSLGNVSNIDIEKGVSPSIDQEVMRVIKLMPRWNPETFDGESVPAIFRLPVNFELDGGGDLTCLDSTARHLNLYWKSQDAVLYDAFSGYSIPSFSRRNKSFYKLYLLHADKETIRRKKIEFSELENRNAYKFNTRRNARRFREWCM